MKLTGTYRNGIVSLLKKNEVEADTVDIEAEWDSTSPTRRTRRTSSKS